MDWDRKMMEHRSRREFLKTATAVLGTGLASQSLVVPPLVHAAGGDKVRLAAVGAGGKGRGDRS
jgi:hypothetical protein